MDSMTFIPTNTLAGSSFDVLKMDAVEDPLISVNKLATIDLEECYFNSAVEFIKESNRELTNCKIELYHALSEATDERVVLESFSDFFTKAKEIIDKFLKFIKSLFQRFITMLNSLVGNEKYITKHKDELRKFKDVDEFKINGYKYTFSPTIPISNASLSFNSKLFDDLAAGENDKLSANNVRDAVNNIDREAAYDNFRAKVLNQDRAISASDFSEELFKVFRDGELDSEELDITSTEVRESLSRFTDYKKTKKAVESDQKRINKDYEELQKQVKEITKRNGDLSVNAFISSLPDGTGINSTDSVDNQGLTMSSELMYQVDLYVKAKVDQIQEFSNIHALAFGAKLDALKACYIQDKAILYKALSKVQRTDKKREEV